jgi:hypothetical protein
VEEEPIVKIAFMLGVEGELRSFNPLSETEDNQTFVRPPGRKCMLPVPLWYKSMGQSWVLLGSPHALSIIFVACDEPGELASLSASTSIITIEQ